jgi:hypothetical protein
VVGHEPLRRHVVLVDPEVVVATGEDVEGLARREAPGSGIMTSITSTARLEMCRDVAEAGNLPPAS